MKHKSISTMKKLISALALVAFALVIFAAAPAVQSADNHDNTTSKVMVKSDIGDFHQTATPDGDKKKKKSKAKSCSSTCPSGTTAAPAKSCCSSSKGTAAKSCCTPKASSSEKPKTKTE